MGLVNGHPAEPWEVYARQDAKLPIRHIGTVNATNVDDATVFAYTLYEEWKWADMFIVKRSDTAQVVRPA
jgi:1,2-phenylacetyl-CoA epoxidase PaaB subunit